MHETKDYRTILFWTFLLIAVLLGTGTITSGVLLYQEPSWSNAAGTAILAGGALLCALEASDRRTR